MTAIIALPVKPGDKAKNTRRSFDKKLSFRIKIASFFVRIGSFLQELPVFILQPRDLIGFGRLSYGKPGSVSFWTGEEFIDSGLFPGEKELFAELGENRGNLLLLGVGGGREAIVLARSGFQVTGVDFVKEMVERSVANARERNVEIQGKVQEISRLDFPDESFAVVWFSCSIYSAVPGKKNRIGMLNRVRRWLAPGGQVVCFFYWNPAVRQGRLRWRAGKALSWITLGNFSCEKGDLLKNNQEFLHAFSDQEDVRAEFAAAGFEVVRFIYPEASHNAGALLRRKN